MIYFAFEIMNRDIWVEEFYESDINYWKTELMQLQNSQEQREIIGVTGKPPE